MQRFPSRRIAGTATGSLRLLGRPRLRDTSPAAPSAPWTAGRHYPGASFARLEARIALEALLDELPRLRRCDPHVESVDSFLVRGPRRLRLRRVD